MSKKPDRWFTELFGEKQVGEIFATPARINKKTLMNKQRQIIVFMQKQPWKPIRNLLYGWITRQPIL